MNIILSRIILYSDGIGEDHCLEKELKEVIESLESNTPHTDSVEKWGRQCANPGTILTAYRHTHSLTHSLPHSFTLFLTLQDHLWEPCFHFAQVQEQVEKENHINTMQNHDRAEREKYTTENTYNLI